MKAAVIDSLERGPRFADFAEPAVTGGETLVEVTATGLHPIVRMLASGEHFGSQDMLPPSAWPSRLDSRKHWRARAWGKAKSCLSCATRRIKSSPVRRSLTCT